MLNIYWIHVLALVGCLTAVLPALAASQYVAKNNETVNQQPANNSEVSQPPTKPEDDPAAWMNFHGNAENYRKICERPQSHGYADLCQQWRSAEAAEQTARWALPQFVANVLAMVGLLATIIYTHRSYKLTARTAQAELRAYLSIGIGQATFQERDKGLRFEGRPILTNNGHTPAHNVSYKASAAILPNPPPSNFPFPLVTEQSGGATLGSGDHFILNAVVEDFVPDEDVPKIMAGKDLALYVWGIVTYNDIFEEKRETCFFQCLTWLPNGEIWGRHMRTHNRAT
jgi:hypothetical protein